MDTDRLNTLRARFPALTLLIVGDFSLDRELITEPAGTAILPETGPEVHQVAEVRCRPGAAGMVADSLRRLGVSAIALGVVGDDGEGFELIRELWKVGVDVDSLIVRPERRTLATLKPRPRGAAHEWTRLDIRDRTPLPTQAEDQVIKTLRGLLPRVHGVIIADWVPEADCGVITERVRDELCSLAQAYPTVVFLADSRARIGLFHDVMLAPEAGEAIRAVEPGAGGPPARAAAEAAAAALYTKAGQPVFLELGSDGILVCHADGPTPVAPSANDRPERAAARDAMLAALTAALCAGATAPEAAQIAVRSWGA